VSNARARSDPHPHPHHPRHPTNQQQPKLLINNQQRNGFRSGFHLKNGFELECGECLSILVVGMVNG
jgi:hypothetical protein